MLRLRSSLATALLLAATSSLRAEPPAVKFNVENMDRTAKPGADFYRFASGQWIKTHEIPADQATWGLTDELILLNRGRLREILDRCAQPSEGRTPTEKQVGDFYAAALDEEQAEKLAWTPLQPLLERIAALKSKDELPALVADLHERGYGGLFSDYVAPDARKSSEYALEIDQGGLGLPNRNYYLDKQFAAERAAYQKHLAKMQELSGLSPAEAASVAKAVFTLETALAKASRKPEDLTDPIENYHKLTLEELAKLVPRFNWAAFLAASRSAPLQTVIVGQPEFLSALNRLLEEVSLEDWKSYLRCQAVEDASPMLNAAAEAEHFAFAGTTLSGQPQIDPRWRRATRHVDESLGEALGQLYMEKYFPAKAKERMAELIGNLLAVYHDRLGKEPWMSPATRAEAVAKLAKFTTKIGGPEKPRDYSAVEVRRDDFLGNVERAAVYESRRENARIGQPVDRTEWEMTSPTVNAYFEPTKNEIVFPAGILQPPFFDPEADDAVNYGATGATIGHEMTHGFDSEGRKFDGDGNLRDWWTKGDAKEFEGRAQKLVSQFNALLALPGLHVNGKLTLTENIADLGGLVIAYEALERALAADPSKRKEIDGFTPEQRFFIAYTQSWVGKERDAYVRKLVATNEHAPDRFRAVAPLQNMQEFYDAFGIKEGAPLWRAQKLRAVIW